MAKSVGCGCDYCMSRGIRRDFRHDFSDGYDETPHRKGAKAKTVKKKKGCPENNFGPHVYIWVDRPSYSWFSDWKYETKVCCGCGKRAHGKSFREKRMRDDTS